jgi:hypothetical protein
LLDATEPARAFQAGEGVTAAVGAEVSEDR